MEKVITTYADDNHKIIDSETGEILHHSDTDNVVYRKITVEELFDESDEEKEDLRFMDDTTYIRNFRGNGVLFREYLTPTRNTTCNVFRRLRMLSRLYFKKRW